MNYILNWLLKKDWIFTWSNKFSKPGGGGDVSVAHRGHGYDGPVQSLRHRYEHRPFLVLLSDVGQSAKYQHSHDDHKHQEAQLFIAETTNKFTRHSQVHLQPVLQCHSQGLETGDMTSQLKNPENMFQFQVNFLFLWKHKTFNRA